MVFIKIKKQWFLKSDNALMIGDKNKRYGICKKIKKLWNIINTSTKTKARYILRLYLTIKK